MDSENLKDGMDFEVRDQSFIETGVYNAHPFASLREAVKNAIEAGATRIHIFPDGRNRTVIHDNGGGMSEADMTQYLSAFGAGAKKRGKDDNMGIGLKAVAPVQNPTGVEITSWVSRRAAHQIVLGKRGPGRYGILSQGGKAIRSVPIPQYQGEETPPTGTLLVLRDTEFQPYAMGKYLNDRFLSLPEGVVLQIFRKDTGGLGARSVNGLLSCLNVVCGKTGTLKLKHSLLHWGIRSEGLTPEERTQMENYTKNVFSANSMYMAWAGEAYAWWEFSRGGRVKLNSWGIRSGAGQVIMIVEALGAKIAPTMDRCSITGWNEEEAREEVVENLPDELRNFMLEWEDKHYDPEFEKGLVQSILSEIGAPTSPISPSQEGALPPGQSLWKEAQDPPARKKRRDPPETRKPSKARGRPGYAFVDRRELGNTAIAYEENAHRILLNKDAPLVKFHEKAPTAKGRSNIRAWMAAIVIAFFEGHFHKYDEVPTEADLTSALLTFSGGQGALMVKHPNWFRSPAKA